MAADTPPMKWFSDFLPAILPAWSAATSNGGPAGKLAASLKAARCEAKCWSRAKRSPPTLHQNCKFLILLFDILEETRCLSAGEACLRRLSQNRLALALKERAAYWKQRGKRRAICEGDANTAYHHAHACQRLRRNQIKVIETHGIQHTSQEAKTRALTEHFANFLGDTSPPTWSFDLTRLYADQYTLVAEDLVKPFTHAEALTTLRAMNRNSAPGPDGFGPSFYQAAWATIQDTVMDFVTAFQTGQADLERLNRAYVVLLPKRVGAVTPDAYRPICLQNCPMKLVAKMLTIRLQKQIAHLIDIDQTGFLKGRSISENFIYAMELVQCCHKRKAATLVLKLDFAKAFDSICWDSLMTILTTRGFPQQWCTWIQSLLSTAKSSVLVNGCPGPWFACKRGLRQGDPLSPYLFLLVADVLQVLIKKDATVKHPLLAHSSCPVLQYADDTLILLRADMESVTRLKQLLESFSAATGLLINFSKSTVVPMHVDEALLPQLIATLGCKEEGFPQTYLGLPLSNEKLRLSAFAPLIAKVDRHLSGWEASLLAPPGRVVLVNSVLDLLPTYAMSAMPLLLTAITQIESRRRAFMWTGEDKASGAQCLVAWEQCCKPKTQGGLGIKNLALQNVCLLMKLIHRLHVPGQSAWAHWVRAHADIVKMEGDIDGVHWSDLRALLPLYRDITTVTIGNGRSTSFWHDCWLPCGRLADIFTALCSHCTRRGDSVHQVLTDGLGPCLVPRLSRVAVQELAELHVYLDTIELTSTGDVRASPLLDTDGNMRAGPLYKLYTSADDPPCEFYKFVWENRAPPRAKFFSWLLVQNRVHCKSNLLKKSIVDDATCEICSSSDETADHLILCCPFAHSFWTAIGCVLPPAIRVAALWEFPRPPGIPAAHFTSYLLLCCWQLWKHRHDVVFRSLEPSLDRLLLQCKETAALWRCRLPCKDAHVVDKWCISFSPM